MNVCVMTVDMPWLERWTLLGIFEKLLWRVAEQWEGDCCRIHSPCSPGHKPCHEECGRRGPYNVSSHPRWKREDWEGIRGPGKGGWIRRFSCYVLRFQYLCHGIPQKDLNFLYGCYVHSMLVVFELVVLVFFKCSFTEYVL